MSDANNSIGPDGKPRCFWCKDVPEYIKYHDKEWGFPVKDDVRLFEKLCLEGFQSGLSWRTILNKRDNFRAAFADFDIQRVAKFTARDRTRLLSDAGIVRHRGKIDATINNARRALEITQEFGSLAAYIWSHEPDPASRPPKITRDYVMQTPTSPESIALSKDLKKRGWKFVGPTTVYAFMQATGLVNDHTHDCITREIAVKKRNTFKPPR